MTSNFQGFYVDMGQGIVHGENENLQGQDKVSEVQIRIMIRIRITNFSKKRPLKTLLAFHCVRVRPLIVPHQCNFAWMWD